MEKNKKNYETVRDICVDVGRQVSNKANNKKDFCTTLISVGSTLISNTLGTMKELKIIDDKRIDIFLDAINKEIKEKLKSYN